MRWQAGGGTEGEHCGEGTTRAQGVYAHRRVAASRSMAPEGPSRKEGGGLPWMPITLWIQQGSWMRIAFEGAGAGHRTPTFNNNRRRNIAMAVAGGPGIQLSADWDSSLAPAPSTGYNTDGLCSRRARPVPTPRAARCARPVLPRVAPPARRASRRRPPWSTPRKAWFWRGEGAPLEHAAQSLVLEGGGGAPSGL